MLSDKSIQKLTPKETRYIVMDGNDLFLEVLPSARKVWRLRNRWVEDGRRKSKVRTLGEWPAMSVYDARVQRDKILNDQHRAAHLSGSGTFHELAEEWHRVKCVPFVTPKRARVQKRRLELYVYPIIGDNPVAHLMPQEVLKLLRIIEAQGYIDVAHDVCQLISAILRYGVATGKAERDVTVDLRGALSPNKIKHRATLRNKQDIADFLRAVWALPSTPARRLMMFTIYTFVRSSEAREAVWTEFDLDRAEWQIPAVRMKMRVPHVVPLSKQVLELVKEGLPLKELSPWIFPTSRKLDSCMSNMALLQILRRLGYGKDQMSIHGLRSIASTTLYEHNWPGDAIERQLAHADRNQVRASYNYAVYMDTRRQMMQWYSDYLDALREGKPEPEVPTLR